jgi:hypothetical protein
MALDTEAAIMANFEFLSHEGDVDMDEDDEDEEMNDVMEEGSKVFTSAARKFKVSVRICSVIIFVSACGDSR